MVRVKHVSDLGVASATAGQIFVRGQWSRPCPKIVETIEEAMRLAAEMGESKIGNTDRFAYCDRKLIGSLFIQCASVPAREFADIGSATSLGLAAVSRDAATVWQVATTLIEPCNSPPGSQTMASIPSDGREAGPDTARESCFAVPASSARRPIDWCVCWRVGDEHRDRVFALVGKGQSLVFTDVALAGSSRMSAAISPWLLTLRLPTPAYAGYGDCGLPTWWPPSTCSSAASTLKPGH